MLLGISLLVTFERAGEIRSALERSQVVVTSRLVTVEKLTRIELLFAAADSIVVSVGVVLALSFLVEQVDEVQSRIARVVDHALLSCVIDEHEHLEIAKDRELHGLLKEALLTLAIRDLRVQIYVRMTSRYVGTYLAVRGILNFLNFINSAFTHKLFLEITSPLLFLH